jgi:hypothetical protein
VTINAEDEQPVILLYQWETTEDAPSPAHLTATFQLPILLRHQGRPPITTFIPNSTTDISPTSSAEWFVPVQESQSQIIVINLWVEPKDFLLVISKQVFTRYTHRASMSSSEIRIPWKDWGPRHTRLVDSEGYTSDVMPAVCGNFMLWRDRLLDFNQPLLARDVLAASKCQKVFWRDTVTSVEPYRGFSGEFSTMLPYRDTPIVLDVIPRGVNWSWSEDYSPGLHAGMVIAGSLVCALQRCMMPMLRR